MAQAITHGRQTGKNVHPSAETGFNKRMHTLSFGVVCPVARFRLRFFITVLLSCLEQFLFGSMLSLTRISLWIFFLNMPLLPFTSIFAPFSKPHQVVIPVLGAKVIPGF